MTSQALLRCLAALALVSLLGACTQKNSADGADQSGGGVQVASIDRFLLFPNPIGTDPFAQNGGAFETAGNEYAAAYYRAIDPNDDKSTLEKWKAANLFGTTGNGTPDTLAVFRDVKDLGYGRRMTGRRNASVDPRVDGSVAFFVENYKVTAGTSVDYSSELNVEAAIRRDTQWHVGTNAIEWSPADCSAAELAEGCNPNIKFAKYYNFSLVDGTRQLAVDLDGRGKKAMPGPCITCHGGRGDPLTPPDASGKPRFPLVENSLSRKRGDVQGRLQGQNVDSFGFSNQPGFTKAEQQAKLKDFNQWVLCTYPTPILTPGLTVTGTWGTCTRSTAGANEWQGTAGPMIEAWYGGTGMPAATFNDTYVPAGWNTNTAIAGTTFTDTDLYKNVVAPYCRTCHMLRGSANGTDGDFMTLFVPATVGPPATVARGFQTNADRIKVHVFDRGNMPLALIPNTDFWNSQAPKMLAAFVDAPAQLGPGSATSASGAVLMPGRPIANPGPDRMVRTGAEAILSAENSLFAGTFAWSQPTPSSNVTITNPNGMIARFQASVAGTYVVRLTVNDTADFKNVTITVDDNFPDPLNIKFAHVKNVLQNVVHGTAKCVLCHVSPAALAPIPTPPNSFNNFDRDGVDGITPTTTDEAWFLKALAGRVNLTEIEASSLLRKPSGKHHRGGKSFDVATATGLRSYSILYNWILAGMPPGGVAADAVVNNGVLGTAASPVLFTFTGPVGGPYASPAINLVGSTSIGATSYAWTVSGPAGPLGTLPSIASPTSTVTTLSVYNVGTYVIQLQVSDGTSTDTVQRTLVVGETPVAAAFAPTTGNTLVTFTGNPLNGNINLTSTSTGSPGTCQWQVTGLGGGPAPAGATLDGSPVLNVTKSCGAPAVLNVRSTSIDQIYSVTLSATSILGTRTSITAPADLTVKSAGSGVTAVISSPTAGNRPTTFTGTSTVPTTNPISTDIALTGSASAGPGTLVYQWSVTAGPAGAVMASPTSANTTVTITSLGTYTVQLFVSNGLPPGPSNTATVTFTATANGTTFSQVWPLFQSFGASGLGCTTLCHAGILNPAVNIGAAPGFQVPNPPNATDIAILYNTVISRVDTTSPKLSLLLLNPSNSTAAPNLNGHIAGLLRPGFDLSGTHNSYDLFLNWIMGGAPNN